VVADSQGNTAHETIIHFGANIQQTHRCSLQSYHRML